MSVNLRAIKEKNEALVSIYKKRLGHLENYEKARAEIKEYNEIITKELKALATPLVKDGFYLVISISDKYTYISTSCKKVGTKTKKDINLTIGESCPTISEILKDENSIKEFVHRIKRLVRYCKMLGFKSQPSSVFVSIDTRNGYFT